VKIKDSKVFEMQCATWYNDGSTAVCLHLHLISVSIRDYVLKMANE